MPESTTAKLAAIAAGFDNHDVGAIMSHFAGDAVYDAPRGPEPYGRRFEGAEAIASAFAARFAGIPDVRYRDDEHFACRDRGASEWTLTGTAIDGQRLHLRGCDLWTLRDGLVVRKDSFWKIREG